MYSLAFTAVPLIAVKPESFSSVQFSSVPFHSGARWKESRMMMSVTATGMKLMQDLATPARVLQLLLPFDSRGKGFVGRVNRAICIFYSKRHLNCRKNFNSIFDLLLSGSF